MRPRTKLTHVPVATDATVTRGGDSEMQFNPIVYIGFGVALLGMGRSMLERGIRGFVHGAPAGPADDSIERPTR